MYRIAINVDGIFLADADEDERQELLIKAKRGVEMMCEVSRVFTWCESDGNIHVVAEDAEFNDGRLDLSQLSDDKLCQLLDTTQAEMRKRGMAAE